MLFGVEFNVTCTEEVLTRFKLVFHSIVYVKAQVKNFEFKAVLRLQVTVRLFLHASISIS